jgi:hypothetical protein
VESGKETIDVFKRAFLGTGERERRARRQTDQETICVESYIITYNYSQQAFHKQRQETQTMGKAGQLGMTRQDLGCSSFILTFEVEESATATDSCDGFEDEDTGFEGKERGFETEAIGSADDFSLDIMTRWRRIIFRWSCFAPFLKSGSQAT